jgi:murein DD-endopeptidase MepM/ murein hydrolase activator NlpD
MNIEQTLRSAPIQQGLETKTPLKAATEEFEGMFITYLLKVMRSTVESEKEGELSMGKDLYMDLFDQEIALTIARNRSLGIGEMMYRQLQESGQETGQPAQPTPQSTAALAAPIQGRLSSAFGLRNDPLTGSPQFHKGVDIAAAAGTPFRAASDGTVVFAGMLNGYGNTVIVDHGGGGRTLYGHASQILVKAGEDVKTEQPLGLIGSTGRSTGPHLHFETISRGQVLDPTALFTMQNSGKVPDQNSR